MESKYFDINRLPENGQIIFFLSMSRLFLGQSPKNIYHSISHFLDKTSELSIDFYCVYTNGLYFNSESNAHSIRTRTTNQMIQHAHELQKLIEKGKKIPPKAIHYLPWDTLLINAGPEFFKLKKTIEILLQTDDELQNLIELSARPNANLADFDFVIEELVLTYLTRTKKIPLPRFLTQEGSWRLIAYHGTPLFPDIYLNEFFKEKIAYFSWFDRQCMNGMYDLAGQCFVPYDAASLNHLSAENFDENLA